MLAVVRFPVGLQSGRRVRGYGTDCAYAGYGTRLHRERQGYFGPTRSGDGTFTDLLWNAAHYYFVDGKMDGDYYVNDPDAYMDRIVLSEREFVASLLEIGERENAVEPSQAERDWYPLMRYLLVTLENGQRYHVNPDRSVSRLADDAPIAISPDGAHTVLRASNESLIFNYIWGEGYMPKDFRGLIKKPGQEAVFSADSNMVAVWNDRHIAVYIYHNGRVRSEGRWYARMALEQVATADLQTDASREVIVKWSADSSTVAWQDDNGIRRWNLFQEAVPELVPGAPHIEANSLMNLSLHGRYVSYHAPAGWRLYDSQTKETHTNAVAAPDENFIITFEPDPDRVKNWRLESECRAPMNENCAAMLRYGGGRRVTVFPYQMELLGNIFCDENSWCDVFGISWHPSTSLASAGYSGGRNIAVTWEDVRQIAYDPYYDQPAVLRGDYQIEFDFDHSGFFTGAYEGVNLSNLDYENLEDVVDSPIASIEWGQPIFYDTFMLTATAYLPRTVTIAQADSLTRQDNLTGLMIVGQTDWRLVSRA